MKKGYVQVYTGDGKGKTTAAVGLAVRAAGAGLRVYFGQVGGLGDLTGNVPDGADLLAYLDLVAFAHRHGVSQAAVGSDQVVAVVDFHDLAQKVVVID